MSFASFVDKSCAIVRRDLLTSVRYRAGFSIGILSAIAEMAVAIGIVAAAVQIVVQKGSAVVWLLGSAVWFLTGTLFPVNALPKVLQTLSSFIPMTHALSAMRLALLQGATLHALRGELLI